MKKIIKNPFLRIAVYSVLVLVLLVIMLIPDPIPIIDEVALFIGQLGLTFTAVKDALEVF